MSSWVMTKPRHCGISNSMNVVITGGNRGIGLELIRYFLNQGHTVTAWVREPERASELLKLSNPKLKLVKADMTNAEQIKSAAQQTDGPVDILINNAGIYKKADGKFKTLDLNIVRETLETNLLGPMM